MIIEVLFAEVCNLYGDPQNVEYLSRTMPDARIIHTTLDAKPFFAESRPEMIIICSMSDGIQHTVVEKLLEYRDRLISLIEDNVVILATGNACEVFCSDIENVTLETKFKGLEIFPYNVKIDWFDRYNGKVLADLDGLTVTGFKSQFSMIYGDNSGEYFVKVDRGIGINRESKLEGFRRNNFIGTHILGPILPLNPEFCEYLISLTGIKATAAFKDVAMDAYLQRVKEFSDPNIKFE
jgi:CobQ-like glutamine amidotransferase family enzyme